MIVEIYGLQLGDAYRQVIDAREQVNEIVSAHRASYQRGEPGQFFVAPFTQAQLRLEQACERLKERIASAARAA